MKIRALRVRETGVFRDPVALEGFSGGLNVLTGPNELGKSTLFAALQAIFTSEHRTTRKELRGQIVPYAGGAPLIEVDFDLGDTAYRLRKRYFTAPKATLTRLGDGQLLRGADAEARLAELLAEAGGQDRLGLMWVEQTGALSSFGAGPGAVTGLKILIERQLTEATGGRASDAVRRLIRERLNTLETPGRKQPTGDFKQAIDGHAKLTRDLDLLQQKAAQGQAALVELARLRDSQAELGDVAAAIRRVRTIEACRSALEAARAAGAEARAGSEKHQRLAQDSAKAAAALAEFDRRSSELAGLGVKRQQAAATLEAARTQVEQTHTRFADADEALCAAQLGARDLAAALETSRGEAAARGVIDGLRKRHAQAAPLAEKLRDLQMQLSQNAATPDLAEAAQAAVRALETLEARLSAVSVRVMVAYDSGADGRILRDGQAVLGDAEQLFAGPVELVIPGVGRIKIAAGDLAAHSALLAKREQYQAELAANVARAGVLDVAALRERAVQRANAAVALDRAIEQLRWLCPQGLETLTAEIDRLVSDLPVDASDPSLLMAKFAVAQTRLTAAEAEHRAAQQASKSADVAAVRIEAETKTLEQRQAELSLAHPPLEMAAKHRDALQAAALAAADAAAQALVLREALRNLLPDAAQIERLQSELAMAVSADDRVKAQAAAQAREIAVLEEGLKRDAADGIAERLAECQSELWQAQKVLATLKKEAAALTLLDAQFAEVEATTRARYLAPVVERLGPYLQTLLPGAALGLSESFEPVELARQGRSESIARLSHGTREQISVLVRLGLGRLLADEGEPLPLILDDALVYADDERIEASFAALRQAADHHQVIVLTCRTKSFAALDGNRLSLRPWRNFSDD